MIEELYTFPQLINDEEHTERVIAALRGELGAENVELVPPKMGSEDFGWLGESIGVPSVFWMFGGADPQDENPAKNHSPFFLPVPEPTLTTGVRTILSTVGSYLGR